MRGPRALRDQLSSASAPPARDRGREARPPLPGGRKRCAAAGPRRGGDAGAEEAGTDVAGRGEAELRGRRAGQAPRRSRGWMAAEDRDTAAADGNDGSRPRSGWGSTCGTPAPLFCGGGGGGGGGTGLGQRCPSRSRVPAPAGPGRVRGKFGKGVRERGSDWPGRCCRQPCPGPARPWAPLPPTPPARDRRPPPPRSWPAVAAACRGCRCGRARGWELSRRGEKFWKSLLREGGKGLGGGGGGGGGVAPLPASLPPREEPVSAGWAGPAWTLGGQLSCKVRGEG